jgi:hypothetical protein
MSKALGRYTDIKKTFDAVLKYGALQVKFTSKGAATHFASRAYYYRALIHEKQREQLGSAVASTSSPYDCIAISRKDVPPDTLSIAVNVLNATVTLPDGTVVNMAEEATSLGADPMGQEVLFDLDLDVEFPVKK